MAQRKVYKINTTAGTRYGVGMFEGNQMLASTHHGSFKTEKGAKKKLKVLEQN